LFADAVERAGRNVVAGVAGNGHATRFRRMFELTVTPAHGNDEPAILLNQFDNNPGFSCGDSSISVTGFQLKRRSGSFSRPISCPVCRHFRQP